MPCAACDPDLAPTDPRRDGLHGVRFGDWRLLVFKGREQILDCYEVDVLAGRAWRFVWPPRICESCGWRGSGMAYIDTGRFRVRESSASAFVSRAARVAATDRRQREASQRARLATVTGLDERTRRNLTAR